MKFELLYSEMDLRELELMLQEKMPRLELSVFDMVKEVYEGNGKGLLITAWEKIKEIAVVQLADVKSTFITIIVIILISALFSTFKDTFQNVH